MFQVLCLASAKKLLNLKSCKSVKIVELDFIKILF